MWVERTFSLIVALLFGTFSTGQTFSPRGGCSAGSKCVVISLCPEMLQLIRSGNVSRVLEANCGFQGNNPKVCCSSNGDGGNVTPPSTLTLLPNDNLLPKEPRCGLPKVDDKILGGAPAKIGAFPWMVAMGYTEQGKEGISFQCAGSLINSRYVLTAAHCLDPAILHRRKLAILHLGDWDLNMHSRDCQVTRAGKRCSAPHIVAGFESFVSHPQYNKRASSSDDIALIRLNITIDFDNIDAAVQPICLPTSNLNVRSLVKKRPIAAGWGLTEHSNYSNIMLRVDVPIKSHDECKTTYKDNYIGNQICVGGEEGIDTCSGDSGGPLILPSSGGPPYTQIGIVSFGPRPCGIAGLPGVYTSVAAYRNWIISNLRP